MKKAKKILALLLAISMILSGITVFGADAELVESPNMHLTTTEPLAPADNLVPAEKEMGEIEFNDIQGHWAETVIRALSANKYVQGNGDGTFAPESNVTRAEFVQMAVNALKLESWGNKTTITDIAEDEWYADAITTAYGEGIINNNLLTEGAFKPEEAITREDAALIISAVAEKSGAESNLTAVFFSKDDEPSEYAKEGVAKAIAYGIMQGDPDGRIRPLDTLTRAEATELLTKSIELTSRLAIYVDPENGSFKYKGTREAPLSSIEEAVDMVKANNQDMQNHLFVFIKGGEHYMESALELGADVSGTNGYNIVFTSYGDERAQLMAGKHYSGFELHDESLNIYKTYVGDAMSRQVYVDGVRGVRARSDGELTNAEIVKDYGFICDDVFLADYKNIDDLEFVTYSHWTQPRCGASEITVENGRAKIVINEDVWKEGLADNTPWNLPHWYENAYELLDTAGEWYIDGKDGYLYYIPRPFENPETMVATIPAGERLLTIQGTAEEPVHNLVFDNLEFSYTTWIRPSDKKGHNDWQNNGIDSKLANPAVYVGCSRYIDFTNSKFTKLGASGLHMMYSIQECDVIGNEFSDISGSAFSMGDGRNGEVYETEVKPAEYKYYTINNKFNNNYIHDIAVEFASAAAVSATYPKNSQFNNNEIANTTYSGFHMGWAWENYSEEAEKKGTGLYGVEVNNNYVHDVMDSPSYDGGPIYLMGVTGGTYENPNECSNNYLSNSRNAHGTLYLDSGATYWRAENNLMDTSDLDMWEFDGRQTPIKPRWLLVNTASARYNVIKDNYATTDVELVDRTYNYVESPALVDMDNLSAEVQSIIDNAGLEEEYLSRFTEEAYRLAVDQKEIVAKLGDTIQLNSKVSGRYNKAADESKYTVYYTSSKPEVASVDENGLVTILSQGRARIYVNLYAGDIVRTREVDLICGDELSLVTPGEITLVKGYYTKVNPVGTSKFGRTLEIEEVTYTPADESIAKADEDGNLWGISTGETTVHAVFTAEETSVETDIAVKVIDHSRMRADNLAGKNLPDGIFDESVWSSARMPDVTVATVADDGKSVSVLGESSYYTKEKLPDGLYSFDLRIDNPSITWPSLAFKVNDTTKRYLNGDCYLIGFNKDYIEVQRFNNGSCTYFMGVSTRESKAGAGTPNYGQVLEFGKTYNIVAGTIEEENGVRVILTVDGKNIIDYLDSDEKALRGDGYFGIYAGNNGTFTLSHPKK